MSRADAERRRLAEDAARERNWKRWGPYLSERQWATVREDYSAEGNPWDYFPHDHARSRAYRWGEDGLLGFTDRQCRLCFGLALWNGKDSILKERLFGLTNPQGNHGEDVKECYYYLDATPTYSYAKALYKYPGRAFPYDELIRENQRRGTDVREYELLDTGVFDEGYFDVQAEYAKASPDDLRIRITLANRGPERAELHVLPSLWFRNVWSWGCRYDKSEENPWMRRTGGEVEVWHETLGRFRFAATGGSAQVDPALLFTENDTNVERHFGGSSETPYYKDAFHRFVIDGELGALRPDGRGTKAAYHYRLELDAGQEVSLELRLASQGDVEAGGAYTAEVFRERIDEADRFYGSVATRELPADDRETARQGYAGLLWSKQFYQYVVADWLNGDPAQPAPPPQRKQGRNRDWQHLFNREVISMPDKWEYPWYASWDLAFHMIPFARIDPEFAKQQIALFLREWYMHPNGQIPAYEFAFGDVNPPVHAWAAWRVYKMSAARGKRDRAWLSGVFQKLLLNFTWWVNRKDKEGNHIFAGGFLGLDNIGVFDRSKELPGGGHLHQADGTAWMAFYCSTMLSMALELAKEDRGFSDMASKFFEHFVAIADAMNNLGGSGLWDDEEGFYFDRLLDGRRSIPLKVRSLVGIIPLFAVEVLDENAVEGLPGFKGRMDWFLDHKRDLAGQISYLESRPERGLRLLAIPSRERLQRVLASLLDEREFLSPYGVRGLSRIHAERPFVLNYHGQEHRVDYTPGESTSNLFGGNSNWRGPIWFPLNYLLIEALERYHHFYGDDLRVECPTGSGNRMNLLEVSREISSRLQRIFRADAHGSRPAHGDDLRYATDPHWSDLRLFYEYFHGDTGRGLGASHQTGWTALIVPILEDLARS
ncbi:glucosidase [Acidobacteria bacterium Mor1]|nr:glucosidase [Acidobacteria bacterium Mor1]